jgi:3,4-dihydroxy 2-butanone 4-phosphate synthase/GTP cyclohydrolase II
LLRSVDLALGVDRSTDSEGVDSFDTVGLGSQILRDLGVGKIALLGPAVKYNAISGFGLEVVDHIAPPRHAG